MSTRDRREHVRALYRQVSLDGGSVGLVLGGMPQREFATALANEPADAEQMALPLEDPQVRPGGNLAQFSTTW